MNMKTLNLVTLFFSLLLVGQCTFAEIAVVVSAKNAASSVSSSDVKKIYLGKLTKLPDGSTVVPVNLKEGDASYEAFREGVLAKSASQLKAYWSKRIFSGKGSPPKVVDDAAAVKQYVVSREGGMGYIDASTVDDTVKVILSIK